MADITLMEKIVSLAKRRGFVYPGSEIYGGLAGTFDYGPMGVVLKENVERFWLQMFRDGRDDMYGVDAAILMNPRVWESSGHVAGFSDPLVDCKKCGTRQRSDHLVEKNQERFLEKINEFMNEGVTYSRSKSTAFLESSGVTYEQGSLAQKSIIEKTGPLVQRYLNEHIDCPECGSRSWSEPRRFNMMFKTNVGASDDGSSVVYLRPETAGGIFANFKNVVDSLHPKLPFGIAQIGKAFRNEIAPRDFIFRLRELSQMEVEYFVFPSEWEHAFEEWRKTMHLFAKVIGLPEGMVHELEVADGDRAHYSKRTIDFEFDYPFGRKELWGLAYRTNFDLSAHEKGSGTSLSYLDEESKERFIPHVIEPSLGVDRTVLAILTSAYREDELGGDTRTYLALSPKIAPVKAMVAPLLKNKPELVAKAREVRKELQKVHPAIAWDDNGNIGKRYRRQDEIGTPFCITIDFDTLGDPSTRSGQEIQNLKDTVTLRHRDTGEQERLSIADVALCLREAIA